MSGSTDAALHFLRIRDAAQHRSNVIAVLKRGGKLAALLWIVAKPMQQLRESPLRGIHPAAPVDRFQAFAMGGRGDFGSFVFGAVVAPQVILTERFQVFANWNHRRAGGVEGDGSDVFSANS